MGKPSRFSFESFVLANSNNLQSKQIYFVLTFASSQFYFVLKTKELELKLDVNIQDLYNLVNVRKLSELSYSYFKIYFLGEK